MLPRRASLALWPVLGLLALAGCGGPTYPKCDKDDHCTERGELCVEGTCQQCRTDANCGAGEQCQAGRCEQKPECVSERDCEGNQVCRSGKCKTECSSDGDCGSGLKCMGERCVDRSLCRSEDDCGPGMTCSGGRCVSSTENVGRSLSTCDYPSVRFGFNEATLGGGIQDGLAQVARCIQESGGVLVVEGHCDERGTEEYNLALGDRRARAVVDYLVRLGVPRDRLRPISKGEAQPLVDRSDEAAWAQNRRVEFVPR